MDPRPRRSGESPAIGAVRDQIRRLVARRETGRRLPSVLLQGETGSGKGLVARVLHQAGPRAGVLRGSQLRRDARASRRVRALGLRARRLHRCPRAKPGLFQTAHRSVIFLDEIRELGEPTQAKLLKVLEGVVRRMGATETEPADVWVTSATNADLEAAERQRAFREDLYHRLAVLSLRPLPLRVRGRDVILLARRFLDACTEYGLSPKRRTSSTREGIGPSTMHHEAGRPHDRERAGVLLAEASLQLGEAESGPRPRGERSLQTQVNTRLPLLRF
jgi:DNA-binding NtrC family response regulator